MTPDPNDILAHLAEGYGWTDEDEQRAVLTEMAAYRQYLNSYRTRSWDHISRGAIESATMPDPNDILAHLAEGYGWTDEDEQRAVLTEMAAYRQYLTPGLNTLEGDQ